MRNDEIVEVMHPVVYPHQWLSVRKVKATSVARDE